MFCSQCGNKVEDNARFCSKCGYKINTDVSEKKTLETKGEVVKEFCIYNKTYVKISDLLEKYICIRRVLEEREKSYEIAMSENLKKDFISNKYGYDEIFDRFYTYHIPYLIRLDSEPISIALKILKEHNIYGVDAKLIVDSIMREKSVVNAMVPFVEAKNSIAEFEDKLNNSPSKRWAGGGFGVTNAIIASVKAEAMNVGMSAASGLAKFVTGMSDDDRVSRRKIKIINNNNMEICYQYMNLAHNIYEGVIDVIFRILKKEAGYVVPEFNNDKLMITCKNYYLEYLESDCDKEKAIKRMCELIESCPYNNNPFMCIYKMEPNTRNNLEKLRRYLGITPVDSDWDVLDTWSDEKLLEII